MRGVSERLGAMPRTGVAIGGLLLLALAGLLGGATVLTTGRREED